MHDGMPYGQNQGQRQGHSREVDRQSPTGLIFYYYLLLHDCVRWTDGQMDRQLTEQAKFQIKHVIK